MSVSRGKSSNLQPLSYIVGAITPRFQPSRSKAHESFLQISSAHFTDVFRILKAVNSQELAVSAWLGFGA